MNNDVFEKYSIPKAVASMALPTILGLLVTVFYNIADTYFIGQTGDKLQVAAVSLCAPIFTLLTAFGTIWGVGGSSYISRLLGEKNPEKIKQVSSFCFYASIFSGLVLAVVVLFNMDAVLKLIGCDPETYEYAKTYLTYIACTAAFSVVPACMGSIIRSEGAAGFAMLGMVLGTIVNLILDPVLILWAGLGVEGAAIATVLGNIVAAFFYVLYFLCFAKKKTTLSIHPRYFKAKDEIATSVLKIGLPASLMNILMSAATIVMNKYLAGYGNTPVAAMGIVNKVIMLPIMLETGLATGVQPLIGYCYGAGQKKKMNKIANFTILCNVVIGSVLTAIYFLFTGNIIAMFIDDAEVIASGITMLRALTIIIPVIGIMFVYNTCIQAMGKGMAALILSVSRQGLVFIPVLLIGNALFGVMGVVYAQPIADLATLVMSIIIYRFIMRNYKADEYSTVTGV